FAKPILRPLLQQMPRGKAKAAQMRQAAQSVDFDTARLSRRLEDSLRRLKRDRVEIFLLHGPTLDDLADGRLYDLLDTLKERGLAQICGVSANTVHDACHIANSGRIGALQVPLHPGADCADLLSTAERAGVGIMAREVLTGAAPSPETLPRVLSPLVQDPRISTILVGTTARAHLDMNVSAYQAALAGSA
ncbi:MAG: aldo/keto reductase, partial [Pseudomonadota bacterium]